MSAPIRPRRDQRGFTLIELLAALAIIATVMVPVTAWALFAMRQQSDLTERNTTSTGSGLLRTYFTADVASAASVTVPGTDCLGGNPVLQASAGADSTVYAVAPAVDVDGSTPPGRMSLWRRECGSSPANVQIVEGVDEASVTVACDPGPDCRVARISMTRVDDPSHPISLTAGKRATS